ncbi:MASE3 domain-containing protein [Planktothricoides sp. SR001]|uniref:MASE3 domain-containing protein n=1 Tax=Planktothricoides sp. SR001 TaxID=1705388 RepID=UPI000AA1A951|nr:MASE3 domain-containing protein [Planktothricoides sp. SR001]
MKNINLVQLVKSMPILNPGKFIGKRSSSNFKLPPQLTAIVSLICVLPFLMNLLGVDFASSQYALDFAAAANLDPRILDDQLHQTLAGSFTHTILEWSAFCAAIFTTILAFAHFTIKRETTTLVIGIALLCAGIMDAFHTLAADRLISAAADNHNLIPFTWAICRMFNALLTIIGVSIFLFFKSEKWQGNITVVIITSLIFGLIAYQMIKISATSHTLPETIFPDSLITRPWDVAPLITFILAGLLVYPKFYQRYPSVFAHSLSVSTIPNAATQIHMAFGSKALFDNDFNIGHFLKIIAYLVPLAGLIIDYIKTHHQLKKTNQKILNEIDDRKRVEENLRRSEEMLKTKNEDLNQAFGELQLAQIKLIQKEKMASLGNLVGGIAHEINNPINFIYGNLFHTEEYTKFLL